jgi:hypothetical protein
LLDKANTASGIWADTAYRSVANEACGAMPRAVINGTGMTRVSLGAGAIGGPAKNVAGVLNGTSFRSRHP